MRVRAPKKYPTLHCKNCGELFTQRREWALFCSDSCRYEFHGEKRKENEASSDRKD